MLYRLLLQSAKRARQRPSLLRAAYSCSRPAISIPEPPGIEEISYIPPLYHEQDIALNKAKKVDPTFGLRYFVPPDQSTLLAYWPDLKDRLLARPGAFPPISSITACSSYEIHEVPGKGKSMFATETIAPGALIARERPLFVVPRLLFTSIKAEQNHLPHMPEHIRDKFLALHNRTPLSHPEGIMDTNSISVGHMPGQRQFGEYCAAYNDISVRHSCNSNAKGRWNLDMFAGELRALRTIAAGEEVTVTLVDTFASRAMRQAILRQLYGFDNDCACEICSLPPAALAQDDLLRETISREWDRFWWRPSYVQELPLEVNLGCVAMLEAIRYETPAIWRVHAGALARAYCALGQREDAVRWARKAMEKTMASTGDDGGWAAVVEAPERTDVWRSQAVGK